MRWSQPYILAIMDLVLFTLLTPGLPDWEDAEDPYQKLVELEYAATGALPSEM